MPGLKKPIRNEDGFTLVELMVTVLLTAIAVISIYRGYTSFSQAADTQQQLMEMQQNLRIGMLWLAKDIREAGMNEEDNSVAGFIAGTGTTVEFSMDLGSGGVYASDTVDNDDDGLIDENDESRIGDGDVDDDGERIKYYLATSAIDPSTNDLVRESWDSASGAYGAPQTVITNVEALNFVYYDKDDNELDLSGGALSAGDLAIVDRVEVTLVERTTNEDYRYTNNETYNNLKGSPILTVSPADNFRRRAFSMALDIRNNI